MEADKKIWYKDIQNSPEPWLDWIESEIKKYEGRIYRNDWVNISVDNTIVFPCGEKKNCNDCCQNTSI